VELEETDGKINVLGVTGNGCKRGITYAEAECVAPVRTLTTTVRTAQGHVVAVKTAAPIPKEKMMEAMKVLSRVRISEPVHIGDTVVEDILGTGVKVVATANI
jgi:CxxC motif-containing protein